MWYATFDTPLEKDTLSFIKDLLTLDISCKAPSLLAKWLPSENASSAKTKHYARIIKNYLDMTSKQYRKTLSYLQASDYKLYGSSQRSLKTFLPVSYLDIFYTL